MIEKAVVVSVNSGICSAAGWLAWVGWEEGAFEITFLGGIFILLGLDAIYKTIKGRD